MADTTDTGVPRAVAIGWGLQAAPQRGPSRGLTHERIVQRAVEIADEQGLAALTMARLAESLGFTTMSLYRYVANKEELLLLMIGAEWLLPPRPPAGEDWRTSLREWVGSLRQMYRDHPWVLDVTRGPTSVLMPASMEIVDRGLEAVRELPLADEERIGMILVVSSYVASFALLERDLAGQEDLEFGPEAMAELGEVITREKLPYAADLFLSGSYVGGPVLEEEAGVDLEYEFGLDLLLDGLAARVAARQESTPPDAD